MYNIRQFTNYDNSKFGTETKGDVEYVIIPQSALGANVVKLSFCINNFINTKEYNIYFTIKGKPETKVKIGKSGIFEINVEDYYNTAEERYKTIKPLITEIKVPNDIEYTLDYVIEV